MTEREMFEQSFQRPRDYLWLSSEEQWRIDKELGILDWIGEGLTAEDHKRMEDHYDERRQTLGSDTEEKPLLGHPR